MLFLKGFESCLCLSECLRFKFPLLLLPRMVLPVWKFHFPFAYVSILYENPASCEGSVPVYLLDHLFNADCFIFSFVSSVCVVLVLLFPRFLAAIFILSIVSGLIRFPYSKCTICFFIGIGVINNPIWTIYVEKFIQRFNLKFIHSTLCVAVLFILKERHFCPSVCLVATHKH